MSPLSNRGGRGLPVAVRSHMTFAALLAAALFTLAFAASPAYAAKRWALKEVFGSANQPMFGIGDRDLAVDAAGNLLISDAANRTVTRWSPDGTPLPFSALGSNVIDGAGGPDATPNGRFFDSGSDASQIAVDNSGTGNIYITSTDAGSTGIVDVFSAAGAYLGRWSGCGAGLFRAATDISVDDDGNLYFDTGFGPEGVLGGSGLYKFDPTANPPANSDCVASVLTFSFFGYVTAGHGPTDGRVFVSLGMDGGKIAKLDTSLRIEYGFAPSTSRVPVAVDPITGHVFVVQDRAVTEYDASGPTEESVEEISKLQDAGSSISSIAATDSAETLYISRSGIANIEAWEATPAQEAETGPPALVSGAKATVTGTIRPFATDVTDCYFEYGRTTSYDRRAPCSPDAASLPIDNGTHQVTAELTGLLAQGATYHYRLVTNGIAFDAGADRTLRTADTYSTEPATAVTGTTATLNGIAKPEGVALTECYFQYGTNFPTARAPCEQSVGAIGTGDADVAVSADITGLDPSTPYNFRLVAVNSVGRITTTERRLTTLSPPIVFTQAARVLQSTATLRARINPAGSPTTYFFEWGPDTDYGTRVPADSGFNLPAGTEPVSVNISISGLAPRSTYHFRVTASNAGGRTVGYDWPLHTLGANSLLGNPILRIGRKRSRRCARGKVRRGGRCVKRKKKAKRHSRRPSGAGARANGVRK